MPLKRAAKPRGRRLRFVGARRFRRTTGTKASMGALVNHNTMTGGLGPKSLSRTMMMSSLVFPKSIMKVLTYADTFVLSAVTLVPTSGTSQNYVMNNLFAPEASGPGTSHQPNFYDQISGLYRFYKVFEWGFDITFHDPSVPSLFCAIRVSSSGDSNADAGGQSFINDKEKPGTWVGLISTTGERSVSKPGHFKCWEVDGMPYREWVGNDAYQAFTNAGPSFSNQLSMAIGNLNADAAVATCRCSVQLWFKARFYGTVSQASS